MVLPVMVTCDDQVYEPFGTMIVAPSDAPLMAVCTREALAAWVVVSVIVEPPEAALVVNVLSPEVVRLPAASLERT